MAALQIPPNEYPHRYQDKLVQIEEDRRRLQRMNEDRYQKALVEVKNDLKEKEGDEIQEKLKQEIREWFQKEQ